ncbi:P-loop containing nucleoside triphosphate hydrolase [Sesbania bispinosa]|nr:P-loop containing nucleoside triphosphate hydrolase [Sesbania bispinosa]
MGEESRLRRTTLWGVKRVGNVKAWWQEQEGASLHEKLIHAFFTLFLSLGFSIEVQSTHYDNEGSRNRASENSAGVEDSVDESFFCVYTLTRILQPSLGGNARTTIIFTLSLERSHVEQTRNTSFLFACCTKEVTTKAQVNVVMSDKVLVKQLQKEVARLESELRTPGMTRRCSA